MSHSICTSILLAVAPTVSPVVSASGDLPQALNDAARAIRDVPPEVCSISIDALLELEADVIAALVGRLIAPETRDDALSEIDANDEREAQEIARELEDDATPNAVRAAIAGYVKKHIRRPVDRSLLKRMRALRKEFETERCALLDAVPDCTPKAHAARVALIDTWRSVVDNALLAINDHAAYSHADSGQSRQPEVDLLVSETLAAHAAACIRHS